MSPEAIDESAKPLPRLGSVRAPAQAPPLAARRSDRTPQALLIGGASALAVYIASVPLPWQTAALRQDGPLNSAAKASHTTLGIELLPGVAGLIVALLSLGFLGWAWFRKRELLVLATRVGAATAGIALMLALVQVYRTRTALSVSGLGGMLQLSMEVYLGFGLYLALLASTAAAGAWGLLASVFSSRLAVDLQGGQRTKPNLTTSGSHSGGGTPHRIPIKIWAPAAAAVGVLLVGGGVAYWILSPKASLANLPKVKAGMTIVEVESLLGPGELVSTTTVPAGFNPFRKDGKPSKSKTYHWRSQQDGAEQEVNLTFMDDRVLIGGGLGESESAPEIAPSDLPKMEDVAQAFGMPSPPATNTAGGRGPNAEPRGSTKGAPRGAPAGVAAGAPPPGRPAPAIQDLASALEALKTGSFDQLRALDWLVSAKPDETRRDEVTRALAALVDGPNALDRTKAARALAAWAGPAQVGLLIHLLEHADQGVRQTAITALGRLKDPQTAPALVQRLNDAADRGAAARALVAIGPAAGPEVMPLLRSPDRGLRREAANILKTVGELKPDAAATLALLDLQDGDKGARVHALQELARAQPEPSDPARPETAAALIALLNDSDRSIRVGAAKALATWAVPENVPVLLDLLGSDSSELRRAAMDALGRLGDKRAVVPIARRLQDGGDRSEATRALQSLGPMAETETLRYLQHREGAVRAAACRVLQMVGTRKSVQPLRYLARNDRSRDAAQAAQSALDGIARRKSTK